MFYSSTKENGAVTFYSWSCRTSPAVENWASIFRDNWPIIASNCRGLQACSRRCPSDWFWLSSLIVLAEFRVYAFLYGNCVQIAYNPTNVRQGDTDQQIRQTTRRIHCTTVRIIKNMTASCVLSSSCRWVCTRRWESSLARTKLCYVKRSQKDSQVGHVTWLARLTLSVVLVCTAPRFVLRDSPELELQVMSHVLPSCRRWNRWKKFKKRSRPDHPEPPEANTKREVRHCCSQPIICNVIRYFLFLIFSRTWHP